MKRVVITRRMVGIAGMQVCAEADATDEEMLNVCNQGNPSGTVHGWSKVIREDLGKNSLYGGTQWLPVKCSDYPNRRHFIVLC